MKTAKKGDKVRVDYTGWFEDGELFDTTSKSGPLEFMLGDGEVFPGIEEALVGMKKGEKKTVMLEPDEAFGDYDNDLIYEIDLDELPEDFSAEEGEEIEIMLEGDDYPAKVLEINEETILLDLNNPLSGKRFRFELTLVDIAK